jgi:ubiquinone/menaquinone biosynthesis C-methylase UbiE
MLKTNSTNKLESRATNSWGNVAGWYNKVLQQKNTFQSEVILPNLLENMADLKTNSSILDLGCGQGFFSKILANRLRVTGVDISKELIEIAKTNSPKSRFYVSKAQEINFLKNAEFDNVLTVLALQNIGSLFVTSSQVYRVLQKNGFWFLVLNHPCFRQPKHSSWRFDLQSMLQYRQVDKYLTAYKVVLDMNPGQTNKDLKIETFSYHYSLSDLCKVFFENGFMIADLQEWISHKTQDQGPKTPALEKARKEIPMFLYLKLKKI